MWGLKTPMVCHGVSGLLLTTDLMSAEPGCEALKEHIPFLKEQLFEYYHEQAPFKFYDYEYAQQKQIPISKAGFLEGVTGILLTLLSLDYPKLNWHLPLLLHA